MTFAEYNQLYIDYAYWLTCTMSQPVSVLYNLYEAWYRYEKSYLLFPVNLLSTTLSLKTGCCHF